MVEIKVHKVVDKEDERVIFLLNADLNIMKNDFSKEIYTKKLTMAEYWKQLTMEQYWSEHLKGCGFKHHELGRSGIYIVVRRKELGHIVLTIQ